MKASNATSRATEPHAGQPRNGPSSSSTAERFTLSGPSLPLDERVHAYRRDIADIALAGQLFAPHYARPLVKACGARSAFIYRDAAAAVEPASELLPGEEFAVLELSSHWAWGYSRADHYVGYIEAISLVEAAPPTHVVAAAKAPIYAEADDRTPPLAVLPMGARLVGHEDRGFLLTPEGHLPFTHVREFGAFEHDPVAVAERLAGSPYLHGGRSYRGIDCSGLIQLALLLCGTRAPRDSDQQRVVGTALAEDEPARRGDLVFFERHVGLMTDAETMIHASGSAGAVVVEPLADVAAKFPVIERRRLG